MRRNGRPAVMPALLVALPTASPASAHARFTGSDPAEGAQPATLPGAVVLVQLRRRPPAG